MISILFALQFIEPPVLRPDAALFPDRVAVVRIYTDCDEPRWPGPEDLRVPKSREEIETAVVWRTSLEQRWRIWFARHGDSITATAGDNWNYPVQGPSRLLNNFANPREGGPHGALDIFVPREGALVVAPVAGIVVASGDGWVGGWRRGRLWYERGGLSRRAGNGVLLFDPAGGGYFLFSHLRNGILVSTGDVVRRGQPLGAIGHSGNATRPGAGRHLHLAYKRPGTACGVPGVLVAENPYQRFRAAQARREER
jgi:murein DD-endopeptidase MepM/ murein hydrolase activator NlpD